MESEEDALLKLIFPNELPTQKDYEFGNSFNEYISKLGTYTNENLSKEVDRLQEDRSTLNEFTQELAVSNYTTFIHTADCSRKSFNRFNSIESNLDRILNNVPKFEDECYSFIKKSESISVSRKLNSLTLVKNVQLLEILELPQLMDNFIKDNLYEDALELAAYVQRLNAKHPDIEIFKGITKDVEKLWQQILFKLLLQLRYDIQLPNCLQIVGHLRRMGIFAENELRLKFLQARDYWLLTNLNAIPKSDANYHLSKTIEVTRVSLFNIITQYRAIFNDDEHSPLVTKKSQHVNQNCIFFGWLKLKITEFLQTLKADLEAGVTSVDSFLGQCMYFGLSFSKVGCDFRMLLLPIFLKSILVNFKNSINSATRDFQTNMECFTLINKNYPKLPWKNKKNELMQPPDSLLEFYPLADYTNKLLGSFNLLRLCAPIVIANEVVMCVEESLVVVSQAIYILYGQEHQAFTPNAKSAFIRLCMAFADDLLPYLQKSIQIIYPLNQLAQYVGVGVQTLREESIATLNRDRIVESISFLLPTKIEPILKEHGNEKDMHEGEE